VSEHDNTSTMFGFERVTAEAKTRRVREVFDSVADRYDIMNDLMSAGLHRLWKRYAVSLLDIRPGHQVLDLAGGTGDLSRLIARHRHEPRLVCCCDINARMLERGRDRTIDAGIVRNLRFVLANGEVLPFSDRAFDRAIIGFGLRNVTDKAAALSELRRVLKPGGRLLVLEFSAVKPPLLAKFYERYSFSILPRLGRWVARDADSYRYLAESIRVHPKQEALAEMIRSAGFDSVRWHNLLGGVVAIHEARTA